MGAIDKLKNYRTLWALVMPHIAVPAPDDVVQWMDYSHDAVEAGIVKTAKRFAKGRLGKNFYPTMAYRYVTATAKSIDQQKATQSIGSDQSLATLATL